MNWNLIDDVFVDKYRDSLISYYKERIVPIKMTYERYYDDPFQTCKSYKVFKNKFENKIDIWFYNKELELVDSILAEKFNSLKKYHDINNFINWKREFDINSIL